MNDSLADPDGPTPSEASVHGARQEKNHLEQVVERIGEGLAKFKRIARAAYLSWKDHPEYFRELAASYMRLKEHVARFDQETGKRLLETVLESRILLQELRASYDQGEFKGALLRGLGQEAIGAGVGVATRPYDVVARDHRSISLALARGTPSYDFWTNHLMRATAPTGGYDPNVHFADLKRNCIGFLASDMAMGAVLINGAAWYQNAKRAHEQGSVLAPDARSCGAVIIGDGAASNGLAHEGMNFAKAWNLPVLFTILNNQIALRTPPKEEHGGIDLANRGLGYEMPTLTVDGDDVFEVYCAAWLLLDFARRANHPALLHAITFRRCGHNDTERTDYLKELFDLRFLEFWMAREQDPLFKTRNSCAALGFVSEKEYSADFLPSVRKRVDDAHQQALQDPEPSLAEYRTALIDPDCKTVQELARTHPPEGPCAAMTMKQAIQTALREEFEQDPLLLMLGEDIGYPGYGVFEVTGSIREGEVPLAKQFRERIRNATLGEAAIGGFLAGAGLLGGRVIVEYQFWNFFLSGASPILTLAATRPFMQKTGIPGVLRGPTGYAPQSNHYHESWPEAYLLKSLGVKVVVPATPKAAKGLLKAAIRDPDLVAFLEEMSEYEMREDGVPEGEYILPFEAVVRRTGKDITVVTWGPKMLKLAFTAAAELAKQKIDIEVIDLQVLNPWDKETVFASVKKTGRIIVLHEDSEFMGFGAEIAAAVATDDLFYDLKARIRRIAAHNTPVPVNRILEDARLPNVDTLVRAARELMEES